jgi:hypothetical protein
MMSPLQQGNLPDGSVDHKTTWPQWSSIMTLNHSEIMTHYSLK